MLDGFHATNIYANAYTKSNGLFVLVFDMIYSLGHIVTMVKDIDVRELLVQIKGATGDNQTQLAERLSTPKLKITQSRVSRWLHGEIPEGERLLRIIAVSELLAAPTPKGTGTPPVQPIDYENILTVGEIGSRMSFGNSDGHRVVDFSTASDESKQFLDQFSGPKFQIWHVDTDVIDENYQPGDYVVVELGAAINPSDLVLAQIPTDSGGVVHIFRRVTQRKLVYASNSFYTPSSIDRSQVQILGIIVTSWPRKD